MGYMEYDIVNPPRNNIIRFGVEDILDDDLYDEEPQPTYMLITTNDVARQLHIMGASLNKRNVSFREIDMFMLTNQGSSMALQQEMMSIALADNAPDKYLDYIWSFYSVPQEHEEYDRWVDSLSRDMYVEMHNTVISAKENFIRIHQDYISTWLRGMAHDKQEMISFLQYLGVPITYGSLSKLDKESIKRILLSTLVDRILFNYTKSMNKRKATSAY